MKNLQESILSSTKSGMKEYLAKQVEDLLHVKRNEDFIIDDSNKIDIWNVPSNTVKFQDSFLPLPDLSNMYDGIHEE